MGADQGYISGCDGPEGPPLSRKNGAGIGMEMEKEEVLLDASIYAHAVCVEYCKWLASECITTSAISDYLDAFAGGMQSLRLLTEWQSIEMGDVGVVDVPMTLSAPLHTALFSLASRITDASISHLLSKTVRKTLSAAIAGRFYEILSARIGASREKSAESVASPTSPSASFHLPSRSSTQILFDCRVLNAMFPDERLKSLGSIVESHMDPFDVSLLSPLINTNVRLSYTRSQVLFASLLVETISSKDIELPTSYSKVQDIVVHVNQPSRIPMIPRLDRASIPTELKKSSRFPKENKLLANPQQGNKAPSLSAFYDRISSSWFGGNN
ncbi:unnamed protein product [Caenorhabditis auriculariae]|uniref:Conserved oligomeric Golgi complex subunit 1 n=1 Tax=Caenorhabditis auriculariae TaxID=2777116 RepID=A0A8S1H600_9PELO|nr:unnamed protein product [Caenorhabditis auriculariae]